MCGLRKHLEELLMVGLAQARPVDAWLTAAVPPARQLKGDPHSTERNWSSSVGV
jgi:hypothetical protein